MKTIAFDSIDSTNSEALRRLRELPPLCVLTAREQTAGRGQRGNTWFSEPGRNLTFSLVVRFKPGQIRAAEAVWLNYLVSDVVAVFLNGFGVDCRIKWPNDIYVHRRKICGILIENTLKGEWLEASVIGVGININQREFPQLANATSLVLACGKEQDLGECLQRICALFEEELPMLWNAESRENLFSRYSSQLFNKGVSARYRDLLQDREYLGVIEGVEPDGRLCIRDIDSGGVLRYYRFKEVSFIL
jgi:BirA family biotin operon repressor/biotin-[acetyl-CoA-carboxylase] ligase